MAFNVGDKVIVNNANLESYRQVGEIYYINFDHTYFVHFDNWRGVGEKCLSFAGRNLLLCKNSNNNNNNSKKEDKYMELNGYNVVAMVRFVNGNNGQEYAFACFDEYSVGQYVMCDTSKGFNLAKITKLIDKDDYVGSKVTKEIICDVDMSAFEKRKADRERKAKLMKKMDELAKKNQNMMLYRTIAQNNPEMAELLAEFDGI